MEHPTDQEGEEDTKVVFRCKGSGKGTISYQWFKDGIKLRGRTDSSLVFDSVKPCDFGCYCCEVRCSYGQKKSESVKSNVAELEVLPREGKSKYHACMHGSLQNFTPKRGLRANNYEDKKSD